MITTDVFGFYDAARAVVLQADGKIVVAGVARRSADHTGPADNLAVARYDMAAGRPSAVYLPLIVRQPQPVFPLANGDFEAGHSGWQEYSKQGYILIVDNYYPLNVQHHGGGWGAWLGGAYNEVSFIEQTVTVPADRPVLTYWHYIHSEDACGNDFGGVVINGSAIDRYDLCAATGTGGWRLHQVDLGSYAGQTVRLQLRAETDAAANSNLMIDDVEFVARTE